MNKRKWMALLLAGVWTLCAQASSIEGTLEGDPHEWFVLSEGRDSSASYVEAGDQLEITITGFTQPERQSLNDALFIHLNIVEGELMHAQVVQLIGAAAIPPFYTSQGSSVTVSLSQFEQSGYHVLVAGRIQGELALQADSSGATIPGEAIAIDVRFDVTASRVEF